MQEPSRPISVGKDKPRGGATEGYRSERLRFSFFMGRYGIDAEAISADIGREG